MPIVYKEKLFKVLSRNDTGETNSHQSGISIPKAVANSEVFPHLGTDRLNPRVDITFYDENNIAWHFQYIYYNDLHFGKERSKAHDEFRLTCVKDFIRQYNVKSGSQIWFGIDQNNVRRIGYIADDSSIEENAAQGTVVIKLSNKWKSIKF